MKYSIIIPTLNEEGNIDELVGRILKSMPKDRDYEIIFVDDNSCDKTKDKVLSLAKKYKNIKFFSNPSKNKDLSKSVVYGIAKSKGDFIIVMDADLSHPPEKLALIIHYLEKGYDVVVGVRKEVEIWPLNRRIISRVGTLISHPLTRISDPLSGFFGFRREIIKNSKLSPWGYKILLEILVKGDYKDIKEINFKFMNREYGESKIGIKVMLKYLIHVMKLYFYIISHKTNRRNIDKAC